MRLPDVTLEELERRAIVQALEAESGNRPGRNQPCFCGSGKKYKACHGSTVSA